jgi:rhodanese-related sulfurtransferase
MDTQKIKSTPLRMALLLGAAVVVGIAYNSVTPLGVAFGAGPRSPVDPNAPSVQAGVGVEHRVQFTRTALQSDNADTPMLLAKAGGGKNLSWPETQSLLAANEIVLIDAREPMNYQTEHIPGAISLPSTCTKDALANFTSKYPPDTPLVVYCESKMCPASHNLARRLHHEGYKNVRVMPGGFVEYRATRAAAPQR